MLRAGLIRVRGTVQGVGFRPFVWRLAHELGLSGWVKNDAEGVLVAAGPAEALPRFLEALQTTAPPAARVLEVRREGETWVEEGFEIAASETGSPSTLISPDLAVCDDCLRELADPGDRRWRYPFINCTNCGPRYSIILGLPYDRPRTTMRVFALCRECQDEYDDPGDRRYHAQPVACPDCGPEVYLWDGARRVADGWEAIQHAARALGEGRIVAVKGIGGYLLAVDAKNAVAVERLRKRKFRKAKPFALMARDLESLRGYVRVSDEERQLLTSCARPIVLLAGGERRLPAAVAPGNPELGFMLPYAPVHHLLYSAGAPAILVMTSGNRSSEPIAYVEEDAFERLAGLADLWLAGTRPIARRIDDSLTRVLRGKIQILRRARGYAPLPVAGGGRWRREALALGGYLKNSVCLVAAGQAFLSQHIGDLDNFESYRAFEETAADLARMYRVSLDDVLLVHDTHPDYPGSRFARQRGGPALAVQHHRAHVASVLAERDAWETPVLGLACDGAGLGEDGTIWGGEIFSGSLAGGLERVGHLEPAWLPGGDAAARYPALAAAGFLGEDASGGRWLPEQALQVARSLMKSRVNTPKTTSVGRLFDAVSALLGFHERVDFEGQAAMGLEALARRAADVPAYPFPCEDGVWRWRPLLDAVLADIEAARPAEEIARAFHGALAAGALAAARALAPGRVVVLSGGVWQNRLLSDLTMEKLEKAGFEVWVNLVVPVNDGGLALGQAALAQVRG